MSIYNGGVKLCVDLYFQNHFYIFIYILGNLNPNFVPMKYLKELGAKELINFFSLVGPIGRSKKRRKSSFLFTFSVEKRTLKRFSTTKS